MLNRRPSILVVDDNPINLRTLTAMLQGEKYEVRLAINGNLALQSIYSDPPNLILMDIRMPFLNGYEVCSTLKQSPETCHIPVIFISALDDVTDKVKAFDVGGADYITKPFQTQEVLARIANQLTIQEQRQQLTELYSQMQRLNCDLENQVHMRTLELQQAFEFEATLKRITDVVRDSLDEGQILQTAIRELALAIGVNSCNAALYNLEAGTATINYEYTNTLCLLRGRVIKMKNFAEAYQQLLQGQYFQHCSLTPHPDRGPTAILTCPISDAEGVIGDLWLSHQPDYIYTKQDIRLVQQVANQCAIALRQARLYGLAQAQIEELKRLNQLKDDFLSTISHELRTPITNMRMVLHMLMTITNVGQDFLTTLSQSEQTNRKVAQYLQILKDECEREIQLVQDLLDLQQLEAESRPLEVTTIQLPQWLSVILDSFGPRFQSQQHHLQVQIADDFPPLLTDPSCLSRIVVELLNNAYKYTPPGGCINISCGFTKDTEEQPQVSDSIPPKLSCNRLQISVTNSGVEIPATELPRIFDKFYRVPNGDPWKHGGTGLGLSLVKRLVEYLGGHISVTSQNQKTTFSVQIPLNEASRRLNIAQVADRSLKQAR